MSPNGAPAGPRLTSASGLLAQFTSNGSLHRFDCGSLSLNLFLGNELEGGPANVYLRRRGERLEWIPLLGPGSPTCFREENGRLIGTGSWLDIDYSLVLVLAASAPAWFWHVRLENRGAAAQSLDLTYAQDLALAPYGAVRMNEYYVSQYIDHTPLSHPGRGILLASRQNQAADGLNPWSLIGSLRRGASFGTDALQLYGLASRAASALPGLSGELSAQRLQHEHSMAIIRDAPASLLPGATLEAGFFGWFLANHPQATAAADAGQADAALALAEARPVAVSARVERAKAAQSLFTAAPLLAVSDLMRAACRSCFPRRGVTRSATSRAACFHSFTLRTATWCCGQRSCRCCDRMDSCCAPVAI